MRDHAPSFVVETFGLYEVEEPTAMDHDGSGMQQAVQHGIRESTSHGDVEVEVSGFIDKMHGQGAAHGLDAVFQGEALLLRVGVNRNGRQHLNDVSPGLRRHDDVAELAHISHRRVLRKVWGRVARQRANKGRGSEVVAHVGTRKGHILDIVVTYCRVASGAACQETVEDVDEPQGPAERLILNELLRFPVGLVARYDTVHLGHTSSLAQIDIGTNGISIAPFVDGQET